MSKDVSIEVERLPIRFEAHDEWVITLPFFHGGESRVHSVLRRVAGLSDATVAQLLAEVLAQFDHRHTEFHRTLEKHFSMAVKMIGSNATAVAADVENLSEQRRWLLGSYFTTEYAVASAALFNPSIVPHPNQKGVPQGGLRFIMSLRATGEGHVSSIIFRTGVIAGDRSVQFDAPSPVLSRAPLSPDQSYHKPLFQRKLSDMAIDQHAIDLVLGRLQERFKLNELEHAIAESVQQNPKVMQSEGTVEGMRWLARENYQLRLADDADISQMVIFPQSDNDHRGIEDLRMVRFVDDDETVTYFGTYTAYDGFHVLPQLMETTDLQRIQVHTLNGRCAQNKGMALFPRRINGQYAMCSRMDGINLHIMYSYLPQFWESAELLHVPKHPWEFMQIGNCGSPIETAAGWLLLTHGVGPMRTYSIGAILLDLNDPLKVIGHLDEPLLVPREDERDGYTPNVVYTCGALVHNGTLFMPYAMSDSATGFAMVELRPLLERLCG